MLTLCGVGGGGGLQYSDREDESQNQYLQNVINDGSHYGCNGLRWYLLLSSNPSRVVWARVSAASSGAAASSSEGDVVVAVVVVVDCCGDGGEGVVLGSSVTWDSSVVSSGCCAAPNLWLTPVITS